MSCENCIKKCKAECCGLVPIPKRIWNKNKKGIKRKILKTKNIGNDDILLFTEDLTCTFLNKNYKCSIYKNT